METLTIIGLSLVFTGAAFYIIGCFINLCNASKPKSMSQDPRVKFLEDQLIIAKNKQLPESKEWRKETKITLASSKRLSEEAVKYMN